MRSIYGKTYQIYREEEPKLEKCIRRFKASFEPWVGISLILSQCLIVSIVNMLVVISVRVHPLEIALTRVMIHFTISVPFVFYGLRKLWPQSKTLFNLIAIRSSSAIGSIVAQTFALAYATSMSNVQTLTATTPIYVIILGAIFLGEKIFVADIALLLLTLAGIVLIVEPVFLFGSKPQRTSTNHVVGSVINKDNRLGYIFAMATALFASTSMIAARRVSLGVKVKQDVRKTAKEIKIGLPLDLIVADVIDADELCQLPPEKIDENDKSDTTCKEKRIRVPFYQLLFYTSSLGIMVIWVIKLIMYMVANNSSQAKMSSTPDSIPNWVARIILEILLPQITCQGPDKLYIIISAFVSAFGQFLFYLALRFEKAGLASIYRTAGIGTTFFLDLAVLNNIPSWNSWVGAALISFSITTLAIRHYRIKKLKQNKPKIFSTAK